MNKKLLGLLVAIGVISVVAGFTWNHLRDNVIYVDGAGRPFSYPSHVNCEQCGAVAIHLDGHKYECRDCRHIQTHTSRPEPYRD